MLPVSHGIRAAAPVQRMDSLAKAEERAFAKRKVNGAYRRIEAKLLPRLTRIIHNGHSPWPLLKMDLVPSPGNDARALLSERLGPRSGNDANLVGWPLLSLLNDPQAQCLLAHRHQREQMRIAEGWNVRQYAQELRRADR